MLFRHRPFAFLTSFRGRAKRPLSFPEELALSSSGNDEAGLFRGESLQLDNPVNKDYLITMPKVRVETTTTHSPEETFEKISSLFHSDTDLKKFDPKYSCQFDKASLSGSASGSQFKAQIKISSQEEGAKIQVTVELPLHLALIKGLIQKTLEKKLQKLLTTSHSS